MPDDDNNDTLQGRLAPAERAIRRAQLEKKIRQLGGVLPKAKSEDVSDLELSFLEHVIAWEEGSFSTHREWLARRGPVFPPPGELHGDRLAAELWRLIKSLAVARVFLYHTNHLSDVELYEVLWSEVLDGDAPDFARTPDDGCHWDLSEARGGDFNVWLTFYATEKERREWVRDFPEAVLPPHRQAPYRRDHRLPVRDCLRHA